MNYRIIVLSSDAVYRRAVGLSLRQLNEDVLFADSIEQATGGMIIAFQLEGSIAAAL